MKLRSGIILSALVGGAIWIGGASSTVAQDAIVPDPAECVVAARTIDNVVDLFMAGDYTPDAEIVDGNLPTGDAASPEAVAGANATLRQFLACSNNNDMLAMMALMTDNGMQFFGPETSEATAEEIEAFFAENSPSPVAEAERERFTPMTEMVVLDDGRVGGVIDTGPGGDGSVYLIFIENDGVWLIDHIVELPSVATPEA